MDIVQGVTTVLQGMAGCLAMAKLLQTMEKRSAAKAIEQEDEEDDEAQRPRRSKTPSRKLFPNGERDEIIAAIDDLKQQARDHRKEHLAIKSTLERVCAHLGIE